VNWSESRRRSEWRPFPCNSHSGRRKGPVWRWCWQLGL